jgi:hypothetical protein
MISLEVCWIRFRSRGRIILLRSEVESVTSRVAGPSEVLAVTGY